jgi:hypothetical protein
MRTWYITKAKSTFLGLIKLGKVCLSDYEAEDLKQRERHRALDNFSDSMDSFVESMKAPRHINCNSTSYGSYTSTNCYYSEYKCGKLFRC